ncbi:LPXTG cell wall anchor domain-containing protein [Corynebacterium glutamicum]|uniref:LPXTG cell wall anchor domain-containing protein n=1 Tax=Corynebacterium glutamicum TaxID=1718 RepID=UPI0002F2F4AD|nr:choice-of-anchor G family protein [Corynebacterium glutamicum]
MNNKRFNFPSKEVKMFRAKITRCIAAILSVFLVAGVVTPTVSQARTSSPYDPLSTYLDDAYSYGYGGLLDLRLLNQHLRIGPDNRALTVAELNGVNQLWEALEDDTNNEEPNTSSINLGLLELINVNLGQISLPLLGDGGLLQFVLNDAQVGVLREFAHAPSVNHAIGAVGVVSDSGGLEVTQPGEGANAEINILSLLDLQSTIIADAVIDEAHLSLGALSAGAVKPNQYLSDPPALNCAANYTEFAYNKLDSSDDLFGTPSVLEQEDGRICSSYQIADAELVISAPLVGGLVTELGSTLRTLLGGVENTLNLLLGSEGALSVLGPVLDPILSVTAEASIDEDTIVNSLLIDPLTSSDELVTIDLGTGLIKVDLEKLHTDGLNNLEPNTSLLTAAQLSKITDTVTNLLTASAADEPNGLNAKLDKILRGENKQGGLYATELTLDVCVLGLIGCTLNVELIATLGGLLTGATGTTDIDEYRLDPYGKYYRSGGLGLILGPVVATLLSTVGGIVEGLLFGDDDNPSGLLGGILGDLQTAVISPLLSTLNPVLVQVLDPIANIIINRQTLVGVEHGTVFTVSALEVNVLDLGTSASDIIHLPLATASVMAQHWEPFEIQLNVAKQGDGRNLHSGGFTYDLQCVDGTTPVFESELVEYTSDKVGERFEYSSAQNQLQLVGATGLTNTAQLPTGAECQLMANPSLATEKSSALQPTGTTPTRTPYTYFLDTNDQGLQVSAGESLWETITDLDSLSSYSVEDAWKQHSITITVPEQGDKIPFNIVHSYDIDTRNIEVVATTDGVAPTDPYVFEYSIDSGATWTLVVDNLISNVPFIDGTSLEPIQVLVREQLPTPVPDVSWMIVDPETQLDSTVENGYSTAEQFAAGYSLDTDSPSTPNLQLVAANGVPVEVNFEAMLPKTGQTTLVWVIGLGLLTALGAVIMYVRSRKQ